MIGMILENGECAVNLLHQNHARQLVWQRHLSKRERKARALPRLFAESVAAANREQERHGVDLLPLEEFSQFFGGKLLAGRIEKNQPVPVFTLTLPSVASRQRQDCSLVFQRQA